MRFLTINSNKGQYDGLLYEPQQKSKTCCVFIHGTASNFHENTWVHALAQSLIKSNISLLTCNASGSNGLNPWGPKSGAVYEVFEDCVPDYDLWLQKLMANGYSDFYIIGHSLGTEKAVYYFNHTIYRNRIKKMVLAGYSDSYSTEMAFLKSKNLEKKAFNEANSLISGGNGDNLMNSDENIHAGVLPKSANSFMNFFSDNTNLKKCLYFPGSMEKYMNIDVPIIGIISDGHEYLETSHVNAENRLKMNKNFKNNIILRGTNHDFDGMNMEVGYYMKNFLNNSI